MSISAWTSPAPSDSTRVLFVGNSLTYYYGVPYLFQEIARDVYGENVSVDSLLQGGGRLAEVASNSVSLDALRGASYDVVILQENGGLLLCGADRAGRQTPECQESLAAHRRILDIAGGDSARGILLGTYQGNYPVAQALVVGEQWVARELALDGYASVALPVLEGKERYDDAPWFAEDGVHPGRNFSDSALFLASFDRKSKSRCPARDEIGEEGFELDAGTCAANWRD